MLFPLIKKQLALVINHFTKWLHLADFIHTFKDKCLKNQLQSREAI